MTASAYHFAPRSSLTPAQLAAAVPAAFAQAPEARTSARYTFISTAAIITALREAGLEPVQARQSRGRSSEHARHMIRFASVRESITLTDCLAEVVLINAHDGTCAYTLRAGLFRPVCTNGMVVELGDFGLVHVAHRGNLLTDIVAGALQLIRGFDAVGDAVQRMHARELDDRERWDFAAQALAVRYAHRDHAPPITPDALLLPRRQEDYGRSLWQTYMSVQEHRIRGGLVGRTPTERLTRTRPIRAIQADVQLNLALWRLALARIH
jgi:hypothetical protein